MSSNNENNQINVTIPAPMNGRVYIEPEYIIVNLIQADKKKYLTVPRLLTFVSYLREQLIDNAAMPHDNEVRFDISFDSIERSVRYHDDIFALVGNTIVVKQDENNISTRIDIPECLKNILPRYAMKFAEILPV